MTKPRTLAPGVTSTPFVCGGVPCVAGTRVSTAGLDRSFLAGWSIARVAREFHLARGQVEAAIRYEMKRRKP